MTLAAGGGEQKRYSLEIGRFFAAFAVLLFHYSGLVTDFTGATVLGHVFRGGHAGVQYFFVLSGFIIYTVHRQDFGRHGATRSFAIKRVIRLYPLFWLISLAMLAGFLLRPALMGDRVLSAGGVAADLLLLPHQDAILAISWTLRHEMIFYALFALALWRGRGWLWLMLPWLAVSLIGRAYDLDAGHLGGLSIVASALNLGFGLGLLIAMRQDRPPLIPPRLGLWGGLALMLGLALLEWRVGRFTDHAVSPLGLSGDIAYLAASAIMIDGAVRREREAPIGQPKLWGLLGGCSYALYLVHQPLGSVGVRLLAGAGLPSLALFLLLSAAAILLAIALHLWIERPLIRHLRKSFAA